MKNFTNFSVISTLFSNVVDILQEDIKYNETEVSEWPVTKLGTHHQRAGKTF